jgi:hypothetical protein
LKIILAIGMCELGGIGDFGGLTAFCGRRRSIGWQTQGGPSFSASLNFSSLFVGERLGDLSPIEEIHNERFGNSRRSHKLVIRPFADESRSTVGVMCRGVFQQAFSWEKACRAGRFAFQ